jgi:ribulose bisphosphate carboxylase small subunit
MQVLIELNDDQADEVLVESLKSGYKINLNFPDEPNFYEINQSFKTLLAYYMGDKEYAKYMHKMAKVRKNNTTKRLVDAHNGL